MEEFLSDTTIHGVEFFTSKSKIIRKSGILVFFIAFCGLGFFVYDIYVKWQLNPLIIEEVNVRPAIDFPFPAVTICNPLFSRDQSPNLNEILKNLTLNPGKTLTPHEQKILAANIHACAPHLGRMFSRILPAVQSEETVRILSEKFLHFNDSFGSCSIQLNPTLCFRMLNYVLTDHGFCFSYNLQGFNQLFKTNDISEDFFSYKRNKIAKIYSKAFTVFNSYETVDDEKDPIQWTLEKGYVNKSFESQPSRASRLNLITFYLMLNISDLSNYCPGHSNTFSLFLHMPNEILTPFHTPWYIPIDRMRKIFLNLISFRTDEDFYRYSPSKRGCYFEGEKPLKFYKYYTKSQCEFECLTNRTLEKCGCVKFSMPRNNSTPICRLDQTTCYLNVLKYWSRVARTCKCFHSCTYIQYVGSGNTGESKFHDASAVRFTEGKK